MSRARSVYILFHKSVCVIFAWNSLRFLSFSMQMFCSTYNNNLDRVFVLKITMSIFSNRQNNIKHLSASFQLQWHSMHFLCVCITNLFDLKRTIEEEKNECSWSDDVKKFKSLICISSNKPSKITTFRRHLKRAKAHSSYLIFIFIFMLTFSLSLPLISSYTGFVLNTAIRSTKRNVLHKAKSYGTKPIQTYNRSLNRTR